MTDSRCRERGVRVREVWGDGMWNGADVCGVEYGLWRGHAVSVIL